MAPIAVWNANNIMVLDKPLYYYNRLNEVSITNTVEKGLNFDCFFARLQILNFIKENGINDCFDSCLSLCFDDARILGIKSLALSDNKSVNFKKLKEFIKDCYLNGDLDRIGDLRDKFWAKRILNEDKFICRCYAFLRKY